LASRLQPGFLGVLMMLRDYHSNLVSFAFIVALFSSPLSNLSAQHCYPEPLENSSDFVMTAQDLKIRNLISELSTDDLDRRDQIHQELKAFGTYSVAALVEKLRAGSPEERSSAALALSKLGKPAVGALGDLLSHASLADTRLKASWALGLMGSEAKGAVEVLKNEGLKDPDRDVRIRSAYSIGKIGHVAESAVPELIHAYQDTDPTMRAAVISALGGIKKQSQLAVPVLMQALNDFSIGVRSSAIYSLGEYGADAEVALPALTEIAIHDSDPDLRADAKTAVDKIKNRMSQRLDGRRAPLMAME